MKTEGVLEFADERIRQLGGGTPAGLAYAKLCCAGAFDCLSCGRPSSRCIAGLPACSDATCGLIARTKSEYRRMKQRA